MITAEREGGVPCFWDFEFDCPNDEAQEIISGYIEIMRGVLDFYYENEFGVKLRPEELNQELISYIQDGGMRAYIQRVVEMGKAMSALPGSSAEDPQGEIERNYHRLCGICRDCDNAPR